MSVSLDRPETLATALSPAPVTGRAETADDVQVLLKVYEMQWASLRQAEEERTQITNIVLLIASAVVGFVAQNGLTLDKLPLALLLIALGAYGAVTSEKLYERWGFFRARILGLEKKLDTLRPGTELPKLWHEAEGVNSREFPHLNKIRLHHLWIVLHLGIATSGIVLSALVIFGHHP